VSVTASPSPNNNYYLISFIGDRFECIIVDSVSWLLASGVRFITSAVCCMLTCAGAVARMMGYRQPVYGMRCITTLRSRRALNTEAQAAAGPTAAYGGQQRQLAAAATTQLQQTLPIKSARYTASLLCLQLVLWLSMYASVNCVPAHAVALSYAAVASVHLPFCKRKCFYCDFPVEAVGLNTDKPSESCFQWPNS
jgi:hypothetical protein